MIGTSYWTLSCKSTYNEKTGSHRHCCLILIRRLLVLTLVHILRLSTTAVGIVVAFHDVAQLHEQKQADHAGVYGQTSPLAEQAKVWRAIVRSKDGDMSVMFSLYSNRSKDHNWHGIRSYGDNRIWQYNS